MAIVIFQLLVSGVMGLKRMPVAAGLMFPVIGFTAYWGNELARCVFVSVRAYYVYVRAHMWSHQPTYLLTAIPQ